MTAMEFVFKLGLIPKNILLLQFVLLVILLIHQVLVYMNKLLPHQQFILAQLDLMYYQMDPAFKKFQ